MLCWNVDTQFLYVIRVCVIYSRLKKEKVDIIVTQLSGNVWLNRTPGCLFFANPFQDYHPNLAASKQ